MIDEKYCLIVVPLRRKSQRLPGKIYKEINAKPMCLHVLERIQKTFRDNSKDVKIIAAVDDEFTKSIVEKEFQNKIEVIMTSPEIPSGTDRVFAAFLEFQKRYPAIARPQGIINVQGDMPHMQAESLVEVVSYFLLAKQDQLKRVPIITLSQEWPTDCRFEDLSHVKVVSDASRHAIYFSRHPIPFSRISYKKRHKEAPELSNFKPELHIGVYGYTPEALAEFCSHQMIPLERFEGLEQLRALWLGKRILVLPCEVNDSFSFRGVDTKEDLVWAKNFLKTSAKSFKNKSQKKVALKKISQLKKKIIPKKSIQRPIKGPIKRPVKRPIKRTAK